MPVLRVSPKTFYEWRRLADAYGLEALMPKARRRPQLSNATPTHVIHELLALAVAEPKLGCRQLGDRRVDRGYVVSKTTVQKLRDCRARRKISRSWRSTRSSTSSASDDRTHNSTSAMARPTAK